MDKKVLFIILAVVLILVIVLVLLLSLGVFNRKDTTGEERVKKLGLAQLYMEKGEYDRALDMLEKLLLENPDDKDALDLMDRILEKKRQVEREKQEEEQRLRKEEQAKEKEGIKELVEKIEDKLPGPAPVVEKTAAVDANKEERERIKKINELMAKGEAVYAQQCAGCHQTEGQGLAPAFPALAGSEVANGSVAKHIDIVMNGSEGTAMQAYSKTLTNAEIAAALTYTRNAFGNQTGDLIQPATIAKHNNG